MRKQLSLLGFVFAFTLVLSGRLWAQNQAAITTDLPDYPPGATAYIYGSGFQPGEFVQVQVLHNDGTPNTGDGHEPWQVPAAADGSFQTSWFVTLDDSANSSFDLTAMGLSSGITARTTFTDAAPPFVNYFSPANAVVGQSMVLTINGGNFTAASTVTFAGVAHPATFINSTRLTINLNAADTADAGSFAVKVKNADGKNDSLNFVVNKANTAVSLASDTNPSAAGQTVTLTAVLSVAAPGAGSPTGTISFKDGTAVLGTAPLVGGVATLSSSTLSVRTHSMKAVYNGDVRFNGSTSATLNQVVKNNAAAVINVSANPSPVGSNVTLIATLSAVAPAVGIPSGQVQFLIDGAPFESPVTLNSGVAGLTTAALAHGPHSVAIQYPGDANFGPAAGGLPGLLVINSAPRAAAHSLGVKQNSSATLSISKLLMTDSDPDGDTIQVVAVSPTSTQGGTLSLSATGITFTPASGFTGADSFTYTLADSYGTTAAATVDVKVSATSAQNHSVVRIVPLGNGSMQVVFAGIPGRSYQVQAATDLLSPDWTTISTQVAGTNGLFEYIDQDAQSRGGGRFYRTAATP